MVADRALLEGVLDLHIHPGPDVTPRSVDSYEVARQAGEAGMRGVFLKSKRYFTYPLAWAVQKAFPDLRVYGGIALDYECGGINPLAVETAAQLGSKICWLPCFSADHDMKKRKIPGVGLKVVGDDGKLLPDVVKIADICKKYDMALGTGHISYDEILALLNYTSRIGFDKVIATHISEEFVGASPSIEQQVALAKKGVYMEHCYLSTLPHIVSKLVGHQGEVEDFDPSSLVGAIKAVGADRCIISTDCGSAPAPTPVEGMARFIRLLLDNGLSEKEIDLMARVNPARLMNLK